MHVYSDGAHCFVCGYNCSLEEVTNEVPIEELKKLQKKEPEKVEEKIKEIEKLPKVQTRGLHLHTGNFGYYIVWPDKSFYKLRRYDDTPRYVGPRGKQPPLFRIESKSKANQAVVITEGELNALSLKAAYPEFLPEIVSPGSATELSRHIKDYLRFKTIIIVVDKDPAGVYYGLELVKALRGRNKRLLLIPLEKDFNQLLQDGGPELVKQVFEREVRGY